MLPLAYDLGLLGHVLLEYHERNAFACGLVSEAITTALRGARLSDQRG